MRVNCTLYVHCLSPSSRITALEVIKLCLGLIFRGATVYFGTGSPRYRGFTITFSSAHYWEGFLWASDRLDVKTSTRPAHDIHKRKTSMPPAGFEPAVPKRERPQIHVIVRAATRIGKRRIHSFKLKKKSTVTFQTRRENYGSPLLFMVLRTYLKICI
jgi:hypothetical protein